MKKYIAVFVILFAARADAQLGFAHGSNAISQAHSIDTLQVNNLRIGNSATAWHMPIANAG